VARSRVRDRALFRKRLGDLISTSLSRLKVGPFEAEFARLRASVEAELGETPSPRSKGFDWSV
jgi:hypothetical protein